jgi:PKD repeat protein
MRHILLFSSFSILFSSLGAQHWSDMMRDHNRNFYDIQTAFDQAWEGREYEKGKGFKQFKRWEWFWEQRVFPSGEFPSPSHNYREFESWKKANPIEADSRTPANWTPIGPSNLNFVSYSPGIGRINAVAQDPINSQIIYVGTPGGGLWKSLNGGSTWAPMTDLFPTLGVSGIAINPLDPNIVYIGTGDGDADDTFSMGVMKSYDGGVTFESTGLSWEVQSFRNVNNVRISPFDNNILFAATDYGLWKSADAGSNWHEVASGDIRDIEFHPTNASIVYASKNLMLRSEDGGESFVSVNTGLPASSSLSRVAIAVSADEPNWVYLLAGDSDSQGFAGFYRSIDAGQTFTLRASSPNLMGWSEDGDDSGGQAWYDMGLAANPNNADQVFVGGVNLWRSNNGGSSWNIRAHWVFPSVTGAYVHADIHTLEYFGTNFYCGSDGGIFKSSNNGTSFSDLTSGIQCSQFYHMGGSATNAGLMLAGAQDNGIILCEDEVCGQAMGADGMNCLINPNNENIMYASIQYGSIRRSTNGGNDFNGYSNDIPESGDWVTPFMLDPTNSNVLFAGYESLWKRNGNGAWNAVSPASSNITAFNIANTDNDIMYVARNSSLSRTLDGGDTWEFINSGLPTLKKTSIEINPNNPMEVWISTSAYSAGQKVYHSTNGGSSWENISLNLPNFPANSIVYENGSNGGLYVAMDVGVYYTNDDLVNWVPFFDGLPNVVVSEVEIHYGSGKLRAATYGRGLWETDLFGEISLAPTAEFSADKNLICQGRTIQYSDESILAETGWLWTFEGGNPASSSEQSPVVIYNQVGTFEASLTVTNGIGSDTEVKTSYIQVTSAVGEALPLIEGFEDEMIDDSPSWFIINPNNDVAWTTNNSIGNGSPSSAWLDNQSNTIGWYDEMVSNSVDLSEAEAISFSFDVAYAQRDDSNSDKLRLFVSDDCGDTWILKKTLTGTSSLPTADPTTEPFFPTADQWQTIYITNIGPSSMQEEFRFKFKYESDGGNNVFIDNINIAMYVSALDEFEKKLEISLYPNPAQEQSTVRFQLEKAQDVRFDIFDLTGRSLWNQYTSYLEGGTNSMIIPMQDLKSGMYIIQLEIQGRRVQRRLLKE